MILLLQNQQSSYRPQTPPALLRPGSKRYSPVCPLTMQLVLLHTFYSQAEGCVCTALQLGADVEQPWLMSKCDVIHKTGST